MFLVDFQETFYLNDTTKLSVEGEEGQEAMYEVLQHQSGLLHLMLMLDPEEP